MLRPVTRAQGQLAYRLLTRQPLALSRLQQCRALATPPPPQNNEPILLEPGTKTTVQKPGTRVPERLLKSPTFVSFVKTFARVLGHNTKTTTAIRETRGMYDLCKDRYDTESAFILQECKLPTTYQTWFQITNLHVWLLTVRLRALPPSHGRVYVQELINHFFLGVEDRMRAVLGPKAPDRVVKSYMKEMRDQWAGVGMALDMSLMQGDKELAATLWRNVFGARKNGKSSEGETASSSGGTATENSTLADVEGDAKVAEQLYYFIAYLRREAKRLEMISDEDVIAGRVGAFGKFKCDTDLLAGHTESVEHVTHDAAPASASRHTQNQPQVRRVATA